MRILTIALSLVAVTATAQELDLSITDPALIAAECGGTAAEGEAMFATACADCHALQPDSGIDLPGPHLGSLFGRGIASLPDYDYSPELRLRGASDDIWERETLRAYLADPDAPADHPHIPVEQHRFDILTYLRTATLPPPPKPGEMEISEEVFAMEGDAPYGEYLAAECSGCHVAGNANVPGIEGLDRRYFITALHEYRARARENETMRLIAARLGDEEIAALAAHFTDE